ncbi:protein-L-isoaspartate O-methyltransferase family protein [Halodesulfurarchaeum sp.]|uniref:protein-L-isoaspartate O-methyltransferase family protein n=1 Tax=Halodesulfurarchaeum sp. TaxID=1980530 RepID=UPI001BC10002|nr:protein-L-isoaspartate O-methyltransferase [Halodesulfurarchaeum sp.]
MEFAAVRADMVDSLEHDTKSVISAAPVGDAMRQVPRHDFVDADHRAYMDQSFTHRGSTVLAPSIAGRLVQALAPEPGDSVLIVGSGVGYTVAVLAEIVGAKHVQAVDISRDLVLDARRNLRTAGYEAVLVDCRDGAEGFPEYAPFDRILLEAAVSEIPRALRDQLAEGGRLVAPRGQADQRLVAFEKGSEVADFGPVGFKPLLVDGEQPGSITRNRTDREDRTHAARAAERGRGWEHDWIEWDGP